MHLTSDKRKKVAIISRESDQKTLDIAMLEAELKRQGADVRVLSRLLTKEKSLKALGYAGHVLKQEAAILSSDVVVLDTYCIPASMIPHRKGTKVVQMWHALAAIKKFGWQTVGKEGGSSEKTAKLMRMHHGYDYVVCASDVTAEHFCEAFRTDRSRIVKYGLPRIDYIKNVACGDRRDDMARKIISAYPQLKKTSQNASLKNEKPVILYAPTFRKGKAVDVQSLIDALDLDKYNLVVKLHPLYRGTAEQTDRSSSTDFKAAGSAAVIYDDSFSSFDWLSVADVIISDYSSLVIESTLADKPLFIYTYDLDEYEENTGLNIDFNSEPIAPYVFRDAASLAKALDTDYDMQALRAFRDRYIDIETDNCTSALADFILSV